MCAPYQGENWIGVPLSGGGIGESYQRGKNEGSLSGGNEGAYYGGVKEPYQVEDRRVPLIKGGIEILLSGGDRRVPIIRE